jgi:hypothetical protein
MASAGHSTGQSMESLVDPWATRPCSSCGASDGPLVDMQGSAAERLCAGCLSVASQRARAKLRAAWWIAGGFLGLGLSVGLGGAVFMVLSDQPPGELTPRDVLLIGSLEGLITAYSAWSLFWGVPAAVRWWMGLSERVARRLGQGTRLLPTAPFFAALLLPVSLGAAYGFLGGAFYERWKCQRVVAVALRATPGS